MDLIAMATSGLSDKTPFEPTEEDIFTQNLRYLYWKYGPRLRRVDWSFRPDANCITIQCLFTKGGVPKYIFVNVDREPGELDTSPTFRHRYIKGMESLRDGYIHFMKR